MDQKATIHVLYKKLLALYPQAFRERVGESMLQTFNDLYKERPSGSAGFGFVLWTFTETSMGICREHVLLITGGGGAMKSMIANPIVSPLISFILGVLPFMLLEWSTRSNAPRSDASPMLWVVLWFLSTGFVAVFILIVRSLRAGDRILTHPLALLLGAVLFGVLAWLWGALVIDQMPCFLGGSGC